MRGNAGGNACAWSALAWAAQVCICALLISSYHPERTAEKTSRKRISTGTYDTAQRERLQERVLEMFYHGYDSYVKYAFPHDDLRPLSFSYTDSLGELGTDGMQEISSEYQGVAMTLIDTISTLAVLGNSSEFQRNVNWLVRNLSFDVDVRVNVFEANIRLLGGLMSGHMLASHPTLGPKLMSEGYEGGLLDLAYSLALRLLPAFLESPTGLPYAWVNLRYGMNGSQSITETNTAACGSLIIEMGMLSRLTGNPVFEEAASRALQRLWEMRTPLGLLGSSLDMVAGQWQDANGGVGASADSFYEYLLKAYILYGDDQYWVMFAEAYSAAMQHYKLGGWYHDAHITSGHPTYMQFTSLQAFWPGMQVLAGDTLLAVETFDLFLSVWQRFGLLPERYLFTMQQLHPSEQYYPLRPELIESNTYLHQATRDPQYLQYGELFMDSLYKHAWAPGGWASVRSVATMEQEDHMHSFFLAETCKYLFLLYNDTFLQEGNWVFTTEGHPMPVSAMSQRRRSPPHAHQPPGNATLHTLLTHPFYRTRAAFPWLSSASTDAAARDPLTWTHGLVTEARMGAQELYGKCELQRESGGGIEDIQPPSVEGEPGTYEPSPAACSGSGDASFRGVPEAGQLTDLTWQQPEGWGLRQSNASALAARVCPDYAHSLASSLCHILDEFADHSCFSNANCGVDAGTCKPRICTDHGFCGTVIKIAQSAADFAALLMNAKAVSPAVMT